MLDDCIPNKMPLDTHVAKISFSGAGKNYALIAAYVPILWKYNEVLSAGLQGARVPPCWRDQRVMGQREAR